MKKRLICLALGLTLCLGLGPVGMAEAEDKFPAVNPYPGYADVAESDWFYDNARLCYEIGIMTGTDQGFEPDKQLSNAECVTLAARVGATLRGEPIRAAQPGEEWWVPYQEYRFPDGGGPVGHEGASRWDFLFMLFPYVYDAGLLEPINTIAALPDSDDTMVLAFYNAGILSGTDPYGSFRGGKNLTRAEAAAMVSRITRSALRQRFVPADWAMFKAAYLTPYTGLFPGVEAEEFLNWVNTYIANEEASAARSGREFNWQYVDLNGKTTLANVEAAVLEALGVSREDAVQSYRDFDYQVYYSRLIDLTGETLEPDYAVGVGS